MLHVWAWWSVAESFFDFLDPPIFSIDGIDTV